MSASPGSDWAELELTSHGSLWEAGNPDCWSGGVISFHMSLPGKDGQEPASLSQEWLDLGKAFRTFHIRFNEAQEKHAS